MIYLDTHVIVWLYAGDVERLSERTKELINDNDIYISPIVALELQYLFEIERITETSQTIVADLSDRIGLSICNQNFVKVVNGALQHSWTCDPFDRLIVANAAIHNNILVTKDQRILENYNKAIW